MACIHVPAGTGRVFNTLVAVRDGAIVAAYRKLHLYDAFSAKESTNVQPGEEIPGLVEITGLRVGMMTCYDLRFPEMARRLVIDGAELIALPAAWVRGLGKEAHWEVLVTARALENTCYVVAVGECGERNIGASMVVDPLGVAVARAARGAGASSSPRSIRPGSPMHAPCCPSWPTAVSPAPNSPARRTPPRRLREIGQDRPVPGCPRMPGRKNSEPEGNLTMIRKSYCARRPRRGDLGPGSFPECAGRRHSEADREQELRAKLPEEIQKSNKLISVNSGSFPPYEIVTDTHSMTGASADMTEAIGQLLGVSVEHANP